MENKRSALRISAVIGAFFVAMGIIGYSWSAIVAPDQVIQGGVIAPDTVNAVDLNASDDLVVSDDLTVTDNATLGDAAGDQTVVSGDLHVLDAATVVGSATVTGASQVDGNLTAGNASGDLFTLNAGTIQVSAVTTALNIATNTSTGNTVIISLDGSNQRVGIGQRLPANRLDVNGSAVFGTYAGTAGPTNGLAVSDGLTVGTVTLPAGEQVHIEAATPVFVASTTTSGNSPSYRAVNNFGFGAFGKEGNAGGILTGSANGATLLFSNKAYPIQFGINDVMLGQFTTAGGFAPWSRTVAQLVAITPIVAGEMYYCSNCSPAKIVVSTGTSVGNFAAVDGGSFQ